jgi:23S rRNA pseudouridine1911/1915/1917 synthase
MKKRLIAKGNLINKRLDLGLALAFNDISRSQIKKIIESNTVYINGNIEYRNNYKLRDGDIVEFEYSVPDSNYKIVPEKMELDILYEDDHLIAINKPPGMVAHPATGNWNGTVMNGLVWYYNNLRDVGDHIRSGLIHRIDKDTSGVLLIGKTNNGLWHYTKLFTQRRVEKFYIAVVNAKITGLFKRNDIFEVNNFIGRHPKNRKRMAVVGFTDSEDLPSDARIAQTSFRILGSNEKYALLLASPKTGRTHQIRVHLAHLGFPIMGDSIYNGEKASRLFLHAYKISLRSTDNERLEIVAPLTRDFAMALEGMGLEPNIKI